VTQKSVVNNIFFIPVNSIQESRDIPTAALPASGYLGMFSAISL